MAKNPRLIDRTGHVYGQWTVLFQDGNDRGGGARWRCRCACGEERTVSGANLRSGQSVSCGHEGLTRVARMNLKHGESKTRLHQIWSNMIRRCESPSSTSYENYGGRGITVCQEWRDYVGFAAWARANGYRDDLTIERVDVNGNYEPGNCIWIPKSEQSQNRRMVARAPDGELWWHKAKTNGITAAAYRTRLNDGWPIEQAATLPMHTRRTNPNASRVVLVSLNGEDLPVTFAAKKLGYSPGAVYQRAKRQSITLQEAIDQLASK